MVVERNFLVSRQEVYRCLAYHLFIGRVTESMQQVFIEYLLSAYCVPGTVLN